MTAEPTDLTEHLALAAADAVRKRRTAIEEGAAGNLRSVTVEIELSNGGDVLDVESYLGWKDVIRDAKRTRRAS